MAEPFKNHFNETVIRAMAQHLVRVAPHFDADGFSADATDGLDDLELKQRSRLITDALTTFLPDDFPTAATILVASLAPDTNRSIGDLTGELTGELANDRENPMTSHGIQGWPIMPMADYVARHGQGHANLSLDVLKAMTSRFSSEFAIRPFLQHHAETTLTTLAAWTTDPNEHVRRLVSEGSRPRLPWGMRLVDFIKNPEPVLALLERLKDDPSEYVRRSVANSLNDIAKDHADRVAEIAHAWMKNAPPARQRMLRHGLRSLIKAGHPAALAALGYGPAKVTARVKVLTPEVTLGGALAFEVDLRATARSAQGLIIDYAIHHMRANGRTTAKVFKWKNITLKGGEIFAATRRHPMKPITTRRYYPGRHRVEIRVNGQPFGGADFLLRME